MHPIDEEENFSGEDKFSDDEQKYQGFPGEEEGDEADDTSNLEVLAYPSDFTLKVIWEQWKSNDIYVPHHFQRKFVWNRKQASLLIDSFLLGLPVPSVFLFKDKKSKRNIIVDGHQRIGTIVSFFEEKFPPEYPLDKSIDVKESISVNRTKFRLTKGKYKGNSYSELSANLRRKFDMSVLRASNIIPNKSEYHEECMCKVFERLNTGGTKLSSQEIRNCIWGTAGFNEVLKNLNTYTNWRKIFGKDKPHGRLRDVEIILLVFSLHGDGRKKYTSPLKIFLDDALKDNKKGDTSRVKAFVANFKKCADLIVEKIGPRPCHFAGNTLHVQILEALFNVLIDNIDSIPPDIGNRYRNYRNEYWNIVTQKRRTNDPDTVRDRYDLLLKNIIQKPV